MDNFFGTPKSVLQETIRLQQERISKYEKKLGDLVKAYKVLQDEKKALQETVTALSEETPGEGEASAGSKQQIVALTKSLASLNDTKNTLESRYQYDKKDLLEQIERLKAESLSDKSRFARERENLESGVRELKTKLRHEQHEREQEQTHHVAMLRELQQMLATERARTQRLEQESTEEAEGRRKERTLQEERVRLLSEEKRYLATELERIRSTPDTRVTELEQELEELRTCRTELLHLRQEKEDTSYLNLRASNEQNRIRDLENRVTELSELVSQYDRRQHRDQSEIERLMSRVSLLEEEGEKRSSSPTVRVSVNTVINTAQVTDSPVSPTPSSATTPSPIATASELRELASVEVARLREEMQVCRAETNRLRTEKGRLHGDLVTTTEHHKLALSEISLQHELELREMERGHTVHLTELQESGNRARARAHELLQERDAEIADLKEQLENKKRSSSRGEGVFTELLESSDDTPRPLIFYKQQHEYLLGEVGRMKGVRETLEQSLREKERNEHVYMSEIAQLGQENRRLARNRSRESANMEYLKNVMVRYLVLANGSERRQVLSAILTVLQLTADEMQKVQHKLSPGWLG